MLCGCKGTFSPIELIKGLQIFALDSAINDSRFSPMRKEKLLCCVCSVSLLQEFEECGEYDDWTIGIHGVSIEFMHSDRRYSAIFLPEVMLEHGNIVLY